MDQQPEAPILNIVGRKVALGPQRRDLLPLYQRWANDFAVTRTTAIGLRPLTVEDEQAWLDGLVGSPTDVAFTIYQLADLRPIGNTGLHQIDRANGTAEFGIMIGEKDCWGKGYGTETAALMLDYGFNGLGLHNIMLRVYTLNQRGIRAYARAGFREFGRRREAVRRGGRAYDVVYMDCLATDFDSPVLKQLIEQP